MRQASIVALGSLLLLAAGCGSSGGAADMPAAQVEKNLSSSVAQQVGQSPDSIDASCPGPLKAEQGSTLRCTITAGGATYGVTVTAKSIQDDGKINVGFQVDQQPSG